MADWGLKISKAGKDITSSEPRDFVFDSSNSVANAMIVLRGSGNVTVAGSGSTQTTIAHSLGYIPITMLYCEYTPGSGKWVFGVDATGNWETYLNNGPSVTYVDSTNFKFQIHNNTGSQKIVKYYYFIFGDTAN